MDLEVDERLQFHDAAEHETKIRGGVRLRGVFERFAERRAAHESREQGEFGGVELAQLDMVFATDDQHARRAGVE